MKFSNEAIERMDFVHSQLTDVFSELALLAGLDPASDFRSANLSGVNFSGSDLSGYNFDRADLRRAKWEGMVAGPSSFTHAMRGRSVGQISAVDFETVAERAKHGSTWKERFLAFAFIIDNFGENTLTFDLLNEIIDDESTTYMPLCSALYFASSLVSNHELTRYCKEMASQQNAYSNMFRVRKIRRLNGEFQEQFRSPDLGLSSREILGAVPSEMISATLSKALKR